MTQPSVHTDVLLRVQDLSVEFSTGRAIRAVDSVSLDINAGEILGLVGETGSGKTVFATSLIKLIRRPGRIVQGAVIWRGRNLLTLEQSELRKIRGTEISMIFQNPLPSLNPVKRIGSQLRDLLTYHRLCSNEDAEDRAISLLRKVQLADPERVMQLYPFECSGGMCQRVLIAMALSGNPKLLIADEPTTSLDVTIQAQIIRLILALKREYGMAVLFVSHDLGLVASLCDRVAVMYRGRIVETAQVEDLFARPSHPYTQALLQSSLLFSGRRNSVEHGVSIQGEINFGLDEGSGCRFRPRCPEAIPRCKTVDPKLTLVSGSESHRVACIRRTDENPQRVPDT